MDLRCLRVEGRYRLVKKLGKGSYGDVYLGVHIISGEEVAIKLEPVTASPPLLKSEADMYTHMCGGIGIPAMKWFGVTGDYNTMVINLLGPSLEDMLNFCANPLSALASDRTFSLKTTLMLADQLISRVEYIHECGIIHGDIKPDNLLMGIAKSANQVHIIDFGLAKFYRDPKTLAHIAYREKLDPVATVFSSINRHRGVEQSRRDDMESLGYMFTYFLQGRLPWQRLTAPTKAERHARILESKMSTAMICRGIPREFEMYFRHVRSLRFDDPPDYAHLRKLFRDLFVREGFSDDDIFDWSLKTPNGDTSSIPTRQQRATNGQTVADASVDHLSPPTHRLLGPRGPVSDMKSPGLDCHPCIESSDDCYEPDSLLSYF